MQRHAQAPVLPLASDDMQRLALFRGVMLNDLTPLLAQCTLRDLASGEVLISYGQMNRDFYAVITGRLQVYVERADPLAVIEAGGSVGELSAIDRQPASACVLAETDCRLLVISEKVLWLLVAASHPVAVNLLAILTQRLREVNTRLTEAQKQQRKAAYQASVDALTGLHNRRWLNERLPRLCQEAQANLQPLTAIILDIDHFKRYNDTQGHLAGDRAIAALGQLLLTHLRPMDMAVRYGGEEFVVILPETSLRNAECIAQRLCEQARLLNIATPEGQPLPGITCSLGVSAWMGVGETTDQWLHRADLALYQAKQTGRNRVMVAAA